MRNKDEFKGILITKQKKRKNEPRLFFLTDGIKIYYMVNFKDHFERI